MKPLQTERNLAKPKMEILSDLSGIISELISLVTSFMAILGMMCPQVTKLKNGGNCKYKAVNYSIYITFAVELS